MADYPWLLELNKKDVPLPADQDSAQDADSDEEEDREETMEDIFESLVNNADYAMTFTKEAVAHKHWTDDTTDSFQDFHKNLFVKLQEIPAFEQQEGYPEETTIFESVSTILKMLGDSTSLFQKSLSWFTDIQNLLILLFSAYGISLFGDADKYVKIMLGKSDGGIRICNIIPNSP